MIVFERKNDVIIVGSVSKVTSGTSKNGNDYCAVELLEKTYDPDMDLELEDKRTILFLDKKDGLYGPVEDATRAKKMQLKEGSLVAIRASRSEKEDGTESFFGSRISYVAGGCRFNFKYSKSGPAATVIIGSAIVKDNEISVPINYWDKDAKERYSVWCSITSVNGAVPEETRQELAPNTEGKKPFAAFVFQEVEETHEDKKLTGIKGKFDYCMKVS